MEEWKDIPDYPNYQVSNLGNVRSLKFGKVKLLKPILHHCGYHMLNLFKENKRNKYPLHQLVAMAFLNHKPDGMDFVIDHINSDKLDNRLNNLRIITNRENISKERSDRRDLPIGVYPYNGKYKYRVYITIGGKQKSLGYFNDVEEAAQTYQSALQRIK
jgi:hypothetical protein